MMSPASARVSLSRAATSESAGYGLSSSSSTTRSDGYSCSAADSRVARTTCGSSAYDGTSTVIDDWFAAKCRSSSARGTRTCLLNRCSAPWRAIRYISAEKVRNVTTTT